MKIKKYYQKLDFLRVGACLAILLYHLNFLKGGYLAVCIFLVLSGYLACISENSKKKFSIKDYYLNRLKKIYLPLFIVVFISVAACSIIPNIIWFNSKPEITSVIFGYNNFWQLSANLDYFARHIDSPFMHLWFIGILLQFELVFPFLYIGYQKLKEKIGKLKTTLISLFLTIGFTIYFIYSSINNNMMVTYYSTFTRLFSLLIGFTAGITSIDYGPLIISKFKNEKPQKIIIGIYSLILLLLFIFIDSNNKLFSVSMLLTSLISWRLISYFTLNSKNKLSKKEEVLKYLGSISYEIYLVSYPTIYLCQYLNIIPYLRVILELVIIFLISALIHFTLNNKKTGKIKIIQNIAIIIISIGSIYGICSYLSSKDYTSEMNDLQKELSQNEEILNSKQKEHEERLQAESDNWNEALEELKKGEENIKEFVKELPIVGVGDSVMLGAVNNLYEAFPSGYFDAAISRTAWVAKNIIQDLNNKKMLNGPVVLNLGANGDCSLDCKKTIIELCQEQEVFWLTVTNDASVNVNSKLKDLAETYPNLHIIDWETISKGHTDYFYADGIHLTIPGRQAYVEAIENAIYEVYLTKYQEKVESTIDEHEQEEKNKITFIGNDIFLNAYSYLEEDYPDAKFIINKNFTYDSIKKELEKAIEAKTLNYRVVFGFDSKINLTTKEYQNLFNLLKDYKIYVLTNKELLLDNVTNIDFYKELKKNPDYLKIDKVHLTEKGNVALRDILNNALK